MAPQAMALRKKPVTGQDQSTDQSRCHLIELTIRCEHARRVAGITDRQVDEDHVDQLQGTLASQSLRIMSTVLTTKDVAAYSAMPTVGATHVMSDFDA